MSTKDKLKEFKKANRHLFYKTEKVLVTDILPNYSPPEGQEYAIVTHTKKGPKICNFCSKSYKLVTNKELIIPMMKTIFEEYPDVEVNSVSQRNSRFYIDVLFDSDQRVIGSKKKKIKDSVHPKLRLTNSYDGKVKYSREFGFYRVVCSNGLMVPEGEVTTEGGLHTDKLEELIDPEKLIASSTEFIENSRKYTRGYRNLMKHKVGSLEERIQDVLDNTAFPKRQAEEVAARIAGEMDKLNTGANDWLVYNGFNGELNHNTEFKMTISKRQEVDKQILNFLLPEK